MKISEAKSRLLIPQLMRRLGVPPESIPKYGSPISVAQNVRCPWFHLHSNEDKKPSCSIYADGTRMHCFACGYDIDGPEFIRRWKNQTRAQAFREFLSLAATRPAATLPTKRGASKAIDVSLGTLNEFDMDQIASLRAIDVAAVRWAGALGVLHFSQQCGYRSWVLTDPSRRIVEARRLDGRNYPGWENVGERKAHTIKGSDKSWPIGAELLRQGIEVRAIMLVEGGPDYLAALHFIHQFRVAGIMPVAMLGKAEVHPDAVQLMKGRHVRIYPHNDPDEGGLRAALKWGAQFNQVGCRFDYFRFDGLRRVDGKAVKDLNDLTAVHPQHLQSALEFRRLQSLLP